MALAVVVAAAFLLTGTRAINLHREDACQCLNWKETYAAGRAQCGQGFEFTRMLGYPKAEYGTPQEFIAQVSDSSLQTMLQAAIGGEFCESFYKRFDDNKCARVAMDSSPTEWYGKSWCYVSKECASAMDVAGAQVSAKLCEEGRDSLLSDMDPDALIAYGQKMGFYVPGYFFKVSYPVDRSFFYGESPPQVNMHITKIAELKASGKPVIVDKIDEHVDKMIIFGDKVYVMPNSYDGFKCVEGCEASSLALKGEGDTAYILPKGEIMCMQGTADYLKDVLARLTESNMGLGWVDSRVVAGHCTDRGYVHSAPEACFPEATLWFDEKKEHTDHIAQMDMEFVALYKQAHPELPESRFTSPQVACSR